MNFHLPLFLYYLGTCRLFFHWAYSKITFLAKTWEWRMLYLSFLDILSVFVQLSTKMQTHSSCFVILVDAKLHWDLHLDCVHLISREEGTRRQRISRETELPDCSGMVGHKGKKKQHSDWKLAAKLICIARWNHKFKNWLRMTLQKLRLLNSPAVLLKTHRTFLKYFYKAAQWVVLTIWLDEERRGIDKKYQAPA